MKKLIAIVLAVAALLGMLVFATAASYKPSELPKPSDAICDCYPLAPQLDMDPLAGGGAVAHCLCCGKVVVKLERTNGVCNCPTSGRTAFECDPLNGGECRIYCLGCDKQLYPAK